MRHIRHPTRIKFLAVGTVQDDYKARYKYISGSMYVLEHNAKTGGRSAKQLGWQYFRMYCVIKPSPPLNL